MNTNTYTDTYNWDDDLDYDDFIGMVHQQIAIDNGWGMDIVASPTPTFNFSVSLSYIKEY